MCPFFSLALPDENSFLESIGPFTQWIPREAQLAYRSPVSAEYPIKRTHSHKAVIQSFHLFSSYSKFFYHYSAFSISVSEDQLSWLLLCATLWTSKRLGVPADAMNSWAFWGCGDNGMQRAIAFECFIMPPVFCTFPEDQETWGPLEQGWNECCQNLVQPQSFVNQSPKVKDLQAVMDAKS